MSGYYQGRLFRNKKSLHSGVETHCILIRDKFVLITLQGKDKRNFFIVAVVKRKALASFSIFILLALGRTTFLFGTFKLCFISVASQTRFFV